MLRYINKINSVIPLLPNSVYNDHKRFHLLETNIYEVSMLFTMIYLSDDFLQKNFILIKKILHPFSSIKTKIQSKFIRGKQSIKITNAFMKLYEILTYVYPYIEKLNLKEVKLFDIASAPGMFIFAAEKFFEKHNLKFDWHACSLITEKDKTILGDDYSLYKNNKSKFLPVDLLKETDIKKLLLTEGINKYDIITGDAGIFFDDYTTLQEFKLLDIQYAQMYIALHLCKLHGIVILKMYSMITSESLFIVDNLSLYFENVYIIKPKTSRILNKESYLLCINRNNKQLSHLSIKRPFVGNYTSMNKNILLDYEIKREFYKRFLVNSIINEYQSVISPIVSMKYLSNTISIHDFIKRSKSYNKYYNNLEKLIYMLSYEIN